MNKNPNYFLYAVAIAAAILGALWIGVPLASLAVLAVVLACPLMMVFMMMGMHSGGRRGRDDADDRHTNQHH